MTEKYSYSDVIIDPADPRIEIGKKYYRSNYPREVLRYANDDNDSFLGSLEEISNNSETPFVFFTGYSLSRWVCLIRKKEKKQRYVPFDLSKEEDRNFLRGRWN